MSEKTSRNSLGMRLIVVTIMIFILLIPTFMIRGLIKERELRQREVIENINSSWGRNQVIAGPIISAPYYIFRKKGGSQTVEKRFIHILPEKLDISAEVLSQIRYRSIFESVVYSAEVDIIASFDPVDLSGLDISPEDITWKEAQIYLGIYDMSGIKAEIDFVLNDRKKTAKPGLATTDLVFSGVSLALDQEYWQGEIEFKTSLKLQGSSKLEFTPLGKDTTILVKSNWPDPGFCGAFLPSRRNISAEGFQAEWNVFNLNRNYPQVWTGDQYYIEESDFGIEFIIPVDHYQKTMRSIKYAFISILLIFVTFFMIELLNTSVLHPIQYLLSGLSLLIFYSLLLSLSEHISFNLAYFISALLITIMIFAYSISILKNFRKAFPVLSVLILFYGYLFTILQLQDYALMIGSFGLMIILGSIMYLTRNINWFEIFRK